MDLDRRQLRWYVLTPVSGSDVVAFFLSFLPRVAGLFSLRRVIWSPIRAICYMKIFGPWSMISLIDVNFMHGQTGALTSWTMVK